MCVCGGGGGWLGGGGCGGGCILSVIFLPFTFQRNTQVSILHKSKAGHYRPVRVADGPIAARDRFIKNVSWDVLLKSVLL